MHNIKDQPDDIGETNEGFERLRALLPDVARDFADTLYPQPAAMAYFADRMDLDRIVSSVLCKSGLGVVWRCGGVSCGFK